MPTRLLRSVHGELALACLTLAACAGGDGGTKPPTTPTVASVSVALSENSIAVGRSTTASAVARDASGATVAGKNPSWSSSSSAVASVDGAGTVTGVGVGAADIVATIDGQTGRAALTVTPPSVALVTVALASPTVAVGQSTQATAVLRDATGNALTGRSITWATSNAAVASVNTTGLVTGVAQGAATITATSEGRSGSATVTVTAVISLTGLRLLTTAGQPLDTMNVAGRIRVTVDEQVPNGFRGIREIRIGDKVLARDSVFGASGTFARSRATSRDLDTAVPVATISGDRLSSLPLVNNDFLLLQASLAGGAGGGPPTSSTVSTNIRLRNADVVRIYLRPERLTQIGSKKVWSGATEMYVEDLAFSGQALSSIEVVRADAAAMYGASASAGVIPLITQQGSDIGRKITIPATGNAFESPMIGTRIIVRSLTRGATTVSLGAIPQLNGNAPSVDGSLLYTPPLSASLITLPANTRYQETAPISAGVFPVGFVSAFDPVTVDNMAARAGTLGFAPPERNSTVGQRAWNAHGTIGLSGNYLGVSTDLKTFINLSDFQDASGIDPATPVTYYASKNRGTLFDAGSTISGVAAIPATYATEWYIGASFTDLAGNRGFYAAKPNAANPASDGTDARFARLTTTGTLTASGIASGSAWGRTNLGSGTPTLQLRATASLFPSNAFVGSVWKMGDLTKCYIGFGSTCEIAEVLGGTLSQNGAQADLALSLGTLRARRSGLEGGTGDGFFSGMYWAPDLGGTGTTGPYGTATPFNVLVDGVGPSPTITATFPAAGMVTATATLSDNIGAAWGEVGVRFGLDNPVFAGGQLYAPIDGFPLGGDFSTGLSLTASVSWTAPILTTGRFFDPVGGQITSTAFPSNAAYFRGYDFARNAASTFLPYANPGMLEPAPSALQRVTFSTSGSSVCNGTGCGSGVPEDLSATVDVFSSLNTPPLAKMSFMGIPSDGLVRFMGNDVTAVTTMSGAAYRHRYEVSFSPKLDCLSSGSYLLKVMLILADGRQAFFPNSFPSTTLVPGNVGTNSCHRPLRLSF